MTIICLFPVSYTHLDVYKRQDSQRVQLEEEIELQDGAGAPFDQELVSKGELSPVFFGSALTNFGVETFLQHFLKMTSSPLPRMSDQGAIDPMEEEDFSAFVFKIQANMNNCLLYTSRCV